MKREPGMIVTVHCPACARLVGEVFRVSGDDAGRILSYGICDRCQTPYSVDGDQVVAAAKRYRTLLKRQAIQATAEGATPDAETARRWRPIAVRPNEDVGAVVERLKRLNPRSVDHPPPSTDDPVS